MANEEQATYWTETAGPRWLANEQFLDAAVERFGVAAMEAAEIKPGENVLDVGCGTGTTTIELARRTGTDGRVLGLDISPLLLGRASEKASEADADNVAFLNADAQTATIPDGYDVLFSRFGIMFFDDPVAAFTNLHGATAEGGRLAFMCWRDPLSNAWMSLPTMAAATVLGPPEQPPGAEGGPGPFRYADAGVLKTELEQAGYSDVRVDPFDTTMDMKAEEVSDRLTFILQMGPLGEKFVESDADVQQRAVQAVLDASAQYESGGVRRIPAAAWIVRATKG